MYYIPMIESHAIESIENFSSNFTAVIRDVKCNKKVINWWKRWTELVHFIHCLLMPGHYSHQEFLLYSLEMKWVSSKFIENTEPITGSKSVFWALLFFSRYRAIIVLARIWYRFIFYDFTKILDENFSIYNERSSSYMIDGKSLYFQWKRGKNFYH